MAIRNSDVVRYGREVGSHWIALSTGVVLGLMGFGASATAVEVPQWLFWVASVVFLTVAQFRTWLTLRREIDSRDRADNEVAERSTRLRTDRDLKNETFYIWELLKDTDDRPIVKYRTFEDCTIQGPGLVALSGGSMNHCSFNYDDIREISFLHDDFDVKQGLTMLLDCTFERCEFKAIAFYTSKSGREDLIANVRQL